jgi:vesicle-fusing ATPase
MRLNERLGKDVDIAELAQITQNFDEGDLEVLRRAAISVALWPFIKIGAKIEVDTDAAEKLLSVDRADFLYSLEHDNVKPGFVLPPELLTHSDLAGGIHGQPIQDAVDEGNLLVREAAGSDGSGLVSILLEGAPNAGETALANDLAAESGFTMVSPEDRVADWSDWSAGVVQTFEEADRSEKSCIVIDDEERLLDYRPVDQDYSNPTLGRHLLSICKKQLLQWMETFRRLLQSCGIAKLTSASKS